MIGSPVRNREEIAQDYIDAAEGIRQRKGYRLPTKDDLVTGTKALMVQIDAVSFPDDHTVMAEEVTLDENPIRFSERFQEDYVYYHAANYYHVANWDGQRFVLLNLFLEGDKELVSGGMLQYWIKN